MNKGGMNSGISALHKILKDETRRKIILQLNEKGSLSYIDLMKLLKISSTGKMNYHLKVLGTLLSKNETGQYMLSEKGKLAVRVMQEFSTKTYQQEIDTKTEKKLWIIGSLASIGYVIVVLSLYFFGSIDFGGIILNVLAAFSAIALGYIAIKIRTRRTKWSPKQQMLGIEISYILIGVAIGMVTVFFGGALLLLGVVNLLRSAGISIVLFPFGLWVVIGPTIGLILG
jgi:DNA-binding transcriptional ArsR family regulator